MRPAQRSDSARTSPVRAAGAVRSRRIRLPLVLLLLLAMVVASVGPVMGQTADPSLAGRPPDDVTDPPPLFTFEQYPPPSNKQVSWFFGKGGVMKSKRE